MPTTTKRTNLHRLIAKAGVAPVVNVPPTIVNVPPVTVNVSPTPVTVSVPPPTSQLEDLLRLRDLKNLDDVRLRALVRNGIASPQELVARVGATSAASVALSLGVKGTTERMVNNDWVKVIKKKYGIP
jgi:hypothetical protein